jgi:hypothetical protein
MTFMMAMPEGKIEREYTEEFAHRGETWVIHSVIEGGYRVSHKELGWGVPGSNAPEISFSKEKAMAIIDGVSEEQWGDAMAKARDREAQR